MLAGASSSSPQQTAMTILPPHFRGGGRRCIQRGGGGGNRTGSPPATSLPRSHTPPRLLRVPSPASWRPTGPAGRLGPFCLVEQPRAAGKPASASEPGSSCLAAASAWWRRQRGRSSWRGRRRRRSSPDAPVQPRLGESRHNNNNNNHGDDDEEREGNKCEAGARRSTSRPSARARPGVCVRVAPAKRSGTHPPRLGEAASTPRPAAGGQSRALRGNLQHPARGFAYITAAAAAAAAIPDSSCSDWSWGIFMKPADPIGLP